MASMFQSLLERTEGLSKSLHNLFIGSREAASSSSSSTCSQIVDDLEKLHRRMKRIRALLYDAEEREIRENRVRLWLDELRQVHHEAEDVIEEFEYELLCYPQASEQDQHAAATYWKFEFQQQIVGKMRRVNDRFDEIYNDGLALKLHELNKDECVHTANVLDPSWKKSASSLVDEKGVHGREDEKHKVIKMLVPDVDGNSQCDENVRAVSIVGMGGVGKTTLAQLVYNDSEVRQQFNTRIWICVSQPFDVTMLTKDILEAVQGRPCEFNSGFEERVHKELEGKKFFLVLDDVWNEYHDQWESLWLSLSSGAKGSRVLITTRNLKVSRICRVSPANMYQLGCLSDEDSWLLFEQQAFGGNNSGDYPNLVRLGRQIVQKCKGLPLAVKTLGGMLFYELSEDIWEDVLQSDLWELPEGENIILPALKLSYHYLPPPTKPCFAYCAVFPKNHNFDREELVRMWMAHGYLEPTAKGCMENVGRRYFEELLQRSIFQKQGDGYLMHDLTHDMALSVWGRECCEVVNGKLPRDKARHVSFEWREANMRLFATGPANGLTRFRTFILFNTHWGYTCSKVVVNNLLLSTKHLHVLDLRRVSVSELPDSIGDLKLLRYFALASMWLCRLPESLGNLHYLQTLDVAKVFGLKGLPVRVKELINLRHLILHVEGNKHDILQMMPQGIGRLTQLQMLSSFAVDEGRGGAGIEELTGLNDLQGKLEIKIKNVSVWNKSKGKQAGILKNKQGLKSLALVFQCEKDIQQELLESLQPHTHIKELEITAYGGRNIPKWMSVASPFTSLEKLSLSSSPGFGPILSLGGEEGGMFPHLGQLTIEYCQNLEYVKLWHMPALRELCVNSCSRLTGLDCYCASVPGLSSSSSELQQDGAVVNHIMRMPHIHTIELRYCPRLNLPPLLQEKQCLPLSFRRLDVIGSHRLHDWVETNRDKLVGVNLLADPRTPCTAKMPSDDDDVYWEGEELPSPPSEKEILEEVRIRLSLLY